MKAEPRNNLVLVGGVEPAVLQWCLQKRAEGSLQGSGGISAWYHGSGGIPWYQGSGGIPAW